MYDPLGEEEGWTGEQSGSRWPDRSLSCSHLTSFGGVSLTLGCSPIKFCSVSSFSPTPFPSESASWGADAGTFFFSRGSSSGAVYSQIFGGDPYNLDISAVVSVSLLCLATSKKRQMLKTQLSSILLRQGKISGVAPLVGSLLACLLAGPLADLSARVMARRNKGWFEPEFCKSPRFSPSTIPSTVDGNKD